MSLVVKFARRSRRWTAQPFVDYDGTIVTAGAILKIEAGSISGGGRKAAAMALAKYGVALKISQDGEIQGFVSDKKQPVPKLLFTVN